MKYQFIPVLHYLEIIYIQKISLMYKIILLINSFLLKNEEQNYCNLRVKVLFTKTIGVDKS